MTKPINSLLIVLILVFVSSAGCKKGSDESIINLFSVNDDIEFGEAMEEEIAANPQDFPILDPVASLAYGLGILAFSRDHEYQADEYSVKYLYQTFYDARGIADFFIKLEDAPHPPEFLSTHPSPENRIEKINEVWQSLGGKEGNLYVDSYAV